MIADQNFYDICFMFFYPTASAMAYDQRPKFFRAEHSAMAEGENCAYGPTLVFIDDQPLDCHCMYCIDCYLQMLSDRMANKNTKHYVQSK